MHVGHQPVGVLPEAGIHQLVHGLRLQRLAEHGQQMPLPCATQQVVGQILEMLPALSLRIIAATGGQHMQMGMIVPIAPMGVEHRDVPPAQRLAPDGAIEIIQAVRPTAHERAQHVSRMLVEGRAEHGRHCQDDMPIDHPLVEDPAHLADPGVDGDFSTPQAQGGFTAHGHYVRTLATLQATVFEVPHFLGVAARQHLGHQVIVVGRLVARMGALQRLPMVSKDLLEDIPVPRGGCTHRIAPSWGDQLVAVPRLYHASAASSTPHRPVYAHPHPLLSSETGATGIGKMNFPIRLKYLTQTFMSDYNGMRHAQTAPKDPLRWCGMRGRVLICQYLRESNTIGLIPH